MFPMSITLHNPAQLNAVLAALNLGTAPAAEPSTAELVQIATARKEAAAAQVEKPTTAKTDKAHAPGQRTAEAVVADAPAKTADAQASSTAASAEAKPQASTAATEPIAYATVAEAITEMVKKNRDHVVATLAKFGAKKGPEVKAEDYPAFMAALGA